MPNDDRPAPSDRCGGAAERTDDGGAPVFECADCRNVLGLAAAGPPDGEAGESAPSEGSDGLSAGTVTATDGSLDRLLGLLDAEAGEARRIAVERRAPRRLHRPDGGRPADAARTERPDEYLVARRTDVIYRCNRP